MDTPPAPSGRQDRQGIACHRQIRRSRENGTVVLRGLLVVGAAAGCCRWLDLGGLSVGDMRQVMSGRAGGRRPYRASWEDRLRKQAGRGGAWLNGCAVDRLAGSRTRTQMKESIAVTEQNGFWPDGARLAVSVSMQFEAGGQPVSRASARSPSRSCPASPISGRTASMSTGPARGCPGSWTCWTSTPSR